MLEAVMVKRLRDYTLDLTISVQPGEIMALMGLNGSGKSTTLNIIAGLLQPDSAEITLSGECLCRTDDGTDVPTEDRRIGYVLQNSSVFPHMTVRDNIAFGLRARHLQRPVVTERVALLDGAGCTLQIWPVSGRKTFPAARNSGSHLPGLLPSNPVF